MYKLDLTVKAVKSGSTIHLLDNNHKEEILRRRAF
ncbi:hypothetical protein HNQ94_002037 [Salirhabdus euzebyi]|uniref:Uncharacterized protein n=1 Tax=Salirhabdus euzebyi TaxID=394506 RepID=A0A841Q5C0_9BACI|nr:hypothetical protein [Salirhabdus euzebyi]